MNLLKITIITTASILSFPINHTTSTLSPLSPNNSPPASKNSCALKFLDWYFENCTDILEIYTTNPLIPDCFLKTPPKCPLLQLNQSSIPNQDEWIKVLRTGTRDILLALNSYKELIKIRAFVESVGINQFRRILLILPYPNINPTRSFSILFTLQKRSVAILDVHSSQIHLGDPFSGRIQTFPPDQVEDIARFLTGPPNYHGAPVNATLFESRPTTIVRTVNKNRQMMFEGLDPTIMRTVASKLNLTFHHYWPCENCDYYGSVSNQSASGALGEVYLRRAEMAFNSVFIKDYQVTSIQFSSYMFWDRLCVIVPNSTQIPLSEAVFSALDSKIWIGIGIITVVSCGTLCLITKIASTMAINTTPINYGNVAFSLIQLIYNAGRIKSRMLYQRIFLGTVLLFSLIQFTLYQSALVDVTTTPRYHPNINTLEEVAAKDLTITTSSASLMNTFNDLEEPHMKILQKRLVLIPKNNSTRNRHSSVYLTRRTTFEYRQFVANNYLRGEVREYLVPDCPQRYLLAYPVRKQVFFYHDLNRVLEGIVEGGFIVKWYMESFESVSGMEDLDYSWLGADVGGVDQFPKAFTVEDLGAAFLLLIVGLSVDIGVFVCELLMFKICK